MDIATAHLEMLTDETVLRIIFTNGGQNLMITSERTYDISTDIVSETLIIQGNMGKTGKVRSKNAMCVRLNRSALVYQVDACMTQGYQVKLDHFSVKQYGELFTIDVVPDGPNRAEYPTESDFRVNCSIIQCLSIIAHHDVRHNPFPQLSLLSERLEAILGRKLDSREEYLKVANNIDDLF